MYSDFSKIDKSKIETEEEKTIAEETIDVILLKPKSGKFQIEKY